MGTLNLRSGCGPRGDGVLHYPFWEVDGSIHFRSAVARSPNLRSGRDRPGGDGVLPCPFWKVDGSIHLRWGVVMTLKLRSGCDRLWGGGLPLRPSHIGGMKRIGPGQNQHNPNSQGQTECNCNDNPNHAGSPFFTTGSESVPVTLALSTGESRPADYIFMNRVAWDQGIRSSPTGTWDQERRVFGLYHTANDNCQARIAGNGRGGCQRSPLANVEGGAVRAWPLR